MMYKFDSVYIDDICKMNEQTYSNNDNWEYVNYLDTGNITSNKIDNIQYIDLSVDKLPSRARRKVQNGNIIYSTVRPNQLHYGLIKKQPQNFLVSTGFAVLNIDTTKAVPEYIYYVLTQNKYTEALHAIAEQSTSAYPSIKPSDIGNRKILLPPLETQRKIAKVLGAIDDKIELNNSINKNLEQQAQHYFDEIVSKAAELSYIAIGDICDVKGGKRLPKGINLVTTPNSHPYIRVRDLNDICVAQLNSNYEYVDDETQKTISRYTVSSKDVIISIVGTIGLTAIVGKTLDNANLTENCVKLTNIKTVTSEYILLFLRSKEGQEAIKQNTVGAVQAKLPIKNIQSMKVPVINNDDINKYLEAIFNTIAHNIIENERLTQLRDTLLPKLMNGEIDVDKVEV